MHPIKPVTLGLQRVKGGEKNQSKGEGYAEKGKGGLMAKSDFRVKKCCIYTYFFFKCWLVEPVRFNRFQTLETETEPNRIFL